MQNEEIINKINEFPRWHYQFELKGNLTPIFRQKHINRHPQRKKYFFDPLVKYLGESLKGKRVLDLGCNAGFWSLCALQAECDFIVGIDGRQMHINQANFVFEVNGIDKSKYKFIKQDIFNFDFHDLDNFDIVFCLGLMYHISKHIELMEKISKINTDILVIDTNLSQLYGSLFEIRYNELDEPINAIDHELVMVPTKKTVVDMVKQFGYSCIILKPKFDDYYGVEDYQSWGRRAFICSKKQDLSSFPAEIESKSWKDTVMLFFPPIILKNIKKKYK